MRGRSEYVTQRCHNSPRWETGLTSANDVIHRNSAEDFGNFGESRVELRHASGEDGWLSPKLGQWPLWRMPHEMEDRWKTQNRKNVYLSPYVEQPLNSKVIKSFVPQLRSCKCFSCLEILMFYVIYIWTLYVHFAYPYLAMVHASVIVYAGYILLLFFANVKLFSFIKSIDVRSM